MTVSTDWQIEFGGLLMGTDTDYSITTVSGLADYPEVQSSDHQRLRRHGLLPGDDFLAGRTVTIDLEVKGGGSYSGMSSAMDNLKRACRVGEPESEMAFQIPGIANGGLAYLNTRPRRMASVVDAKWRVPNQPTVTVEFYGTDPRLYGSEESHVIGLPSASGGAEFNAVMNWQFGTVGSGSTLQASNAGTFSTPLQFRIDGPVVNPVITNTTQDRFLLFNLTVGAGEFLLVDTDDRTILLNGTQNRYSVLDSASTWFDLNPGADEITFAGDALGTGTLTVTWRSAWI